MLTGTRLFEGETHQRHARGGADAGTSTGRSCRRRHRQRLRQLAAPLPRARPESAPARHRRRADRARVSEGWRPAAGRAATSGNARAVVARARRRRRGICGRRHRGPRHGEGRRTRRPPRCASRSPCRARPPPPCPPTPAPWWWPRRGPLRVRELSALSFRELGGTDGAVNPFWSPDGRTIAYGKGGKLWRVGVRGGAPAVICELPAAAWDYDSGGAWLPDDTIVFTTGASNLMRVAASGGDAVTELAVAGDDELHFHTVTALPGGRGLLVRRPSTGGSRHD